jgi:hypothetical protein
MPCDSVVCTILPCHLHACVAHCLATPCDYATDSPSPTPGPSAPIRLTTSNVPTSPPNHAIPISTPQISEPSNAFPMAMAPAPPWIYALRAHFRGVWASARRRLSVRRSVLKLSGGLPYEGNESRSNDPKGILLVPFERALNCEATDPIMSGMSDREIGSAWWSYRISGGDMM